MSAKLSKLEFISQLAPQAIQARADGSPMFASVRIAQNLLETGGVIHSWFNLGGIKVGSGRKNEWWDGSSVNKKTWEVTNGKRVDTAADFRAYESVYCFYRDQDRMLGAVRYKRVREATTPNDQARALYMCGYATDPHYADKIISIMVAYGLYKYDSLEDQPMTAEEKKQFNALHEDVVAIKIMVESATKLVAAPKWFVTEFGSADLDGLINDPEMTTEGWRTLAVSLRMQGLGTGATK